MPTNETGALKGQYIEQVASGFRYTYYVIGYTSNKIAGPTSNHAKITSPIDFSQQSSGVTP